MNKQESGLGVAPFVLIPSGTAKKTYDKVNFK